MAKNAMLASAWTLAASVLLALAIHREWMEFAQVGFWAMGVYALAGYLCAGGSGEGRRSAVNGAGAAALYLGILGAVNLMFFGGHFSGSMVAALLVAGGLSLRLLVKSSGGRKRGRTAYKIPRG